ncbi:GNAT family N-acetyltransferase [Sphaerisporangium album]|uniref:GNAT family N-acetyltransferase n=1 Tax=Sphaerisporangium album TaxID=509200 RepID=A0A367EIC6_9ACTN|nr:GNAT family N-acetyltransferase [Sphaerisporangium album]RCG17791.1 GNAT family N-acetyltransferase [Sphaerisporangium album]
MSFTVDHATASDVAELSALIEEIENHYGATEIPSDADRTRMINRLLFGDRPIAWVLLARDGGRVVGMASYSFHWPAAGAEHSMFLKELYVRVSDRRRGVAGVLMECLYEIARVEGCGRVEWQTEVANLDAQAFYESLAGKIHDGKVFYRVDM